MTNEIKCHAQEMSITMWSRAVIFENKLIGDAYISLISKGNEDKNREVRASARRNGYKAIMAYEKGELVE